jgi:hypothetical protein
MIAYVIPKPFTDHRSEAIVAFMTYLLLIPAAISLYFVLRGRSDYAFLYVYLPCLLLVPEYFVCRIPHLPLFATSEWAAIPIGFVAAYRLFRKASYSVGDVLVLCFLISIVLSEALREPPDRRKDGFEYAIAAIVCPMLVYLIGRGLIEPELRLETARRIVLFTAILLPIGLFEWRFGRSVYGMIGQGIFGFSYQVVQLRVGHARAVTAFDDAEIAGIIFAMAAALNEWLAWLSRKGAPRQISPLWTKLERYRVPGLALVALVLLTESRGPILGLAAGYLLLQIRRFRNPRIGTAVMLAVLCAAGSAVYVYYRHYTDVSQFSPTLDEEQASALYRRQMHELYKPLLDRGGWLGMGLLGHPAIPGLKSTDDEFLLVQLGQGKLGLLIFILIAVDSFRRALFNIWTFENPEDRAFACSFLALFAVFWLSITTVYMGEQLPQIAFLFIGWNYSVVRRRAIVAPSSQRTPGKFAFRRVVE